MERHKYLIVGGGMAADAAVRGIRETDPGGDVCLVGSEPDAPYKRPPLSKGLWKNDPEETIWYWTEALGVTLHPGRTVRMVDLPGRVAVDDEGRLYGYEKLLFATGATPRRLPFEDERIVHFRTFADYNRLRDLWRGGRRFAVVGAGFIGMELAAALATNDREVVLLYPGETVGERLFPKALGLFLNDYYRRRGVSVFPRESVTGIARRDGRLVVTTRNGISGLFRDFPVDGVVVGVGVIPNVEPARAAGLPIGNGIRVDECLRAYRPEVFAAGDVAEFPSAALGRRLRVEHEDNARKMGRAAGRAMAGRPEPYLHVPYFYSDLFDLGFEAVGLVDATLETVPDWVVPNREGVVYYLRDGRVRGVLLWNVRNQVEAARRLIAEDGPFDAGQLRGRLRAPKAA